jgi:hypothetical protein
MVPFASRHSSSAPPTLAAHRGFVRSPLPALTRRLSYAWLGSIPPHQRAGDLFSNSKEGQANQRRGTLTSPQQIFVHGPHDCGRVRGFIHHPFVAAVAATAARGRPSNTTVRHALGAARRGGSTARHIFNDGRRRRGHASRPRAVAASLPIPRTPGDRSCISGTLFERW